MQILADFFGSYLAVLGSFDLEEYSTNETTGSEFQEHTVLASQRGICNELLDFKLQHLCLSKEGGAGARSSQVKLTFLGNFRKFAW